MVVKDRRCLMYFFDERIYYKTSLRKEVEEDYWEPSSYPFLMSWNKLLPFDSLVICFEINVFVSENNSAQKKKQGITARLVACVQGCMCVHLCMQKVCAFLCVYVRACLSLPKVCVFVYSVCISARNQVVCRRNLDVFTCVFTFAHMC